EPSAERWIVRLPSPRKLRADHRRRSAGGPPGGSSSRVSSPPMTSTIVALRQRDASALRRVLGFWTVAAIVVGNMLGSGVFFTPGELSAVAHATWQVYLLWGLA